MAPVLLPDPATRSCEISPLPEQRDANWRVIFAFPDSLSPESEADVQELAARLRPENRRRVLQLNYDELAGRLQGLADPVAHGLSGYMSSRLGGLRSLGAEQVTRSTLVSRKRHSSFGSDS